MRRKKDQSISLKFLIFISLSLIGIIIYCTYPNTLEKIKKNITYEEFLENRPKNYSQIKTSQIQPIIKTNQSPKEIPEINYKSDNNFKRLLDELKRYPSRSISSAEIITKNLLIYLGYNGYEIKIQPISITNNGLKPIGTSIAASFDIKTGTLKLNKDLISKLETEEITAIIAHELDHFDKIAKICKSMGAENFFNFTQENNLEIINKDFWINASKKANLNDFNTSLYKSALKRFILPSKLEIPSIYADLYSLSELIRNPLEISAYEISDYILSYYNIQGKESLTKKLANQFNKVDWGIYNITSKDNNLIRERLAIFDYLLMQAIIENNTKYINSVNQCTSTNGDLTPFWREFINDNKEFFDRNTQASAESYNYIIELLKKVELLTNNKISAYNKAEAIKFYVYTLIANTKYKNSITYIKNSIEDYLIYTSKHNIDKPKDILNMYLILICLENNINSYENKDISLYYLKLPPILEKLNNSNKKSQKYNFIYKNPEFTAEYARQKEENPNITEQRLLTEMLEKTASEIK